MKKKKKIRGFFQKKPKKGWWSGLKKKIRFFSSPAQEGDWVYYWLYVGKSFNLLFQNTNTVADDNDDGGRATPPLAASSPKRKGKSEVFHYLNQGWGSDTFSNGSGSDSAGNGRIRWFLGRRMKKWKRIIIK